MKTLSILALALFSVTAQAEPLTCTFTEPFIGIVVDQEAKTVVVTNEQEGESITHPILETHVGKEETRVIFGAGEEENSVLVYREDGQGSDGMSDLVYPYSAQTWTGEDGIFHGGCYTASKPPVGEQP